MRAVRSAPTGVALPLLVLVACGSKDPDRPPPTPDPPKIFRNPSDKINGTLLVDGNRVELEACLPGHEEHTFVSVRTAKGTLKFEEGKLYWNGGDALGCDKLDRSWGGGVRDDKSAYWRGTLTFKCTVDCSRITGDHCKGKMLQEIDGDLALDCGNITDEERRQLDGNRKDMIDQQHGSGSGSSAH